MGGKRALGSSRSPSWPSRWPGRRRPGSGRIARLCRTGSAARASSTWIARTGTPRVLARLDGTLTRRVVALAGGDRRRLRAREPRRARAHRGRRVGSPGGHELPGGVTSVEWRQTVDGIPAADHALRVNVGARRARPEPARLARARAGRRRRTTPSLDAGEAVRAVQDDVGVHRSLVRRRGPSGARRTTEFGDDTSASLVTFGGRLAWRVAVPRGRRRGLRRDRRRAHRARSCGG